MESNITDMSTTTVPLAGSPTTQEALVSYVNFVALLVSSAIFTIFYVKSVKPAELERSIGVEVYARCKWYRLVSGFFMTLAAIHYVVFWYYPLPGLPPNLVEFPWQYHISVYIALILTLPFSYLYHVDWDERCRRRNHDAKKGSRALFRRNLRPYETSTSCGRVPALVYLCSAWPFAILDFVFVPVPASLVLL